MEKFELVNQLKNATSDELEYYFQFIDDIILKTRSSKHSNEDIIAKDKQMICPKCGSFHVVKNGRTKYDHQKLLCKDCKKTFSLTTNSIMFKTKKSYDKWTSFIKNDLTGMCLKDNAELTGISLSTAFYWRHKIYNTMEKFNENCKLSGSIEFDGFYTPINYSGLRHNMPRKACRNIKRGKSEPQVCILTAYDSNGIIKAKIAKNNSESLSEVQEAYSDLIVPNSILITDGFNTYIKASKYFNCTHEIVIADKYKNENGFNMSLINEFHSELSGIIRRCHGVSTKHLMAYVNMLIFKYHIKSFTSQMKYMNVYNFSVSQNKTFTYSEIINMKFPINFKWIYGKDSVISTYS